MPMTLSRLERTHTAPATTALFDPAGLPFPDWAGRMRKRTESILDSALPQVHAVPERLHEAMRYAVLGGGKRLRPLLCLAAGELTGAAPRACEAVAGALELAHVYSLVHDDLPAMDDDDLRRGRPTVHVRYDQATAILVGDALQSQSFVMLAEVALPAERRVLLVRELATAISSLGMAGGQMIDLSSVGRELGGVELERMHQMKTGALIRAAVRMGALCGEPAERADLDCYAQALGLAFQVVDDILDATADSATLGKTAGKDAAQGKPTYVSVFGLQSSRELARQLALQAHAALAAWGESARRLHQLADLITDRAS